MGKNTNKALAKHLHGFWPLFILVVISMIAGAIIYNFAYGNALQDEIISTSVWTRFAPHPTVKKSP
jgi:uncharacterized membrane protein AbrB (regulator of aidB expression)